LASLFNSTASIFDPFFGLGLSSYAAADSLRGSAGIRNITGIEINPSIYEKAKKLGRTVRGLRDVDLRLGSSIEQEWPASDLLLTEPPLGLRLPVPISLGGVTVRDFETYTVLRAALEVCETESRRAAVILTSRSWLSRDRDQALRDKLLEISAVKAILGLPGIKSNTSIPLAAIVITRGNSTAIVGELLEDWREQLTGQIGGLRDLLSV
jgi:type I restriction-modification system DNA methylase subunit